jgi:hypothetical protein
MSAKTVYPPQGTVQAKGTMALTWLTDTNPKQMSYPITLAWSTAVA